MIPRHALPLAAALAGIAAGQLAAQFDPRGRSVLFVRGADGSGGLGQLTTARLRLHRVVVFGSNNRVYRAAEISAFHGYMASSRSDGTPA